MKVREYLNRINGSDQVTFIKARARKDAHTPFYHAEYQTTSMDWASEWLNTASMSSGGLLDYVVLNDRQPPIEWLSGAPWSNAFNDGRLKCLLVISKEDFSLLYSESQMEHMEKFIESKMEVKR